MSFVDDMTFRSGYPLSLYPRRHRHHQQYRQHHPRGDYAVTSTRIRMQIAWYTIQYARLRRTCCSLS